MELSWSCSSSSIPDYVRESFDSFSKGEEETSGQYEHETFESYDSGEELEWHAASELSESIGQAGGPNDEGASHFLHIV